jgi:parvulin-like peptidyl-prolyl isomerase
MRPYFIFFTLISFSVTGQLIEKIDRDLSAIVTSEQANDYLANHPSVTGQLFELNSKTDTTDFDKQLILTSPGNLISFGSEDKKKHFFFKTIETNEVKSFRVQYIFLDGKKLTLQQIDSLRKIILKRINQGEAFAKLATEHSMDGNAKNGGDLGWFEEGMMRREFEERIKSKKTGDVFTVDVPSEKWFYVVRNSHNPRVDKKVKVLYIEINSGT